MSDFDPVKDNKIYDKIQIFYMDPGPKIDYGEFSVLNDSVSTAFFENLNKK